MATTACSGRDARGALTGPARLCIAASRGRAHAHSSVISHVRPSPSDTHPVLVACTAADEGAHDSTNDYWLLECATLKRPRVEQLLSEMTSDAADSRIREGLTRMNKKRSTLSRAAIWLHLNNIAFDDFEHGSKPYKLMNSQLNEMKAKGLNLLSEVSQGWRAVCTSAHVGTLARSRRLISARIHALPGVPFEVPRQSAAVCAVYPAPPKLVSIRTLPTQSHA